MLPGDVRAGKSAHVGLLGVGNSYRLMENLRDVGSLRAGNLGGFRRGQRGGFRNARLRPAIGLVLLPGDELDGIGGFPPPANQRGKRGFRVALIERAPE